MELAQSAVAWQDGAACRGPYQQVFYPPTKSERRKEKRHREARAKEICLQCPVIDDCRDYAFTVGEQHGIWGGLTEGERKEILKIAGALV